MTRYPSRERYPRTSSPTEGSSSTRRTVPAMLLKGYSAPWPALAPDLDAHGRAPVDPHRHRVHPAPELVDRSGVGGDADDRRRRQRDLRDCPVRLTQSELRGGHLSDATAVECQRVPLAAKLAVDVD